MYDVHPRRHQIGAQTVTEIIPSRLPAERRAGAEARGGDRLVAALAAALVVP